MLKNNPYGAFYELINSQTRFRRTKNEGEKSFSGPCPLCQGHKRCAFFLPSEYSPLGNFFCFACGAKGNGASYLSITRGISLPEAYELIGVDPSEVSFSITPQQKREQNTKWEQQAQKVMEASRQLLLSQPKLQTYFFKRGFTLESIKKFGFGFHLASNYSYEDWGLPTDEEHPTFFINSGMILMNGNASLRVRFPQPTRDRKYDIFPSSILSSVTPTKEDWNDDLPTVIVEGDFDAYAVAQGASSVVNPVGLGGGAMRLSPFVQEKLEIAPYIFIATDNDSAGDRFASALQKQYPQAIRLPIPRCMKDPNDILVAGIDMREWIYSAIPSDTRYFFLQNACPDVPEELYAKIERKHQLIYGEALSGKVEDLSTLPAETPVVVDFSSTGFVTLFEPTKLGKVEIALAKADFSNCHHIKYIAADSYKDAALLKQVGIHTPECLATMSAIGTKKVLRANTGNISSLYGQYQAYSSSGMATEVQGHYDLLKQVYPYLSNLSLLRIDPERWAKALDLLDPAEASKWVKEREKHSEHLGTFFRCNLRPSSAASGRFSCTEPPLHSMPKVLRHALVAEEGSLFIAADFHSMQPRILAVASQDKEFAKLFEAGRDYYKAWAAGIFGIPEEQVTNEQRSAVKAPVIAWGFGNTPNHMAETISEDPERIQLLTGNIKKFQMRFKNLMSWKTQQAQEVALRGIVHTVSGRPILVPRDKDFSALCFVASGTEVEIMLHAIIALGDAFSSTLPSARIKFWLHDELLIEVAEQYVKQAKDLVEQELTKSFTKMLPDAPINNLLDITISKGWGGDI